MTKVKEDWESILTSKLVRGVGVRGLKVVQEVSEVSGGSRVTVELRLSLS